MADGFWKCVAVGVEHLGPGQVGNLWNGYKYLGVSETSAGLLKNADV